MDESRQVRRSLDWQAAETDPAGTRPEENFTDIRYETAAGIAKITIDRLEVRNAFRPLTTRELITAFDAARDDPTVGVVVLTGEGPLAFSSGGDQGVRLLAGEARVVVGDEVLAQIAVGGGAGGELTWLVKR